MQKYEKYTGTKTYMFPSGAIATREVMLEQFPAVLAFPHIILTDEGGEVCYAVQNLSAMRAHYGIDAALTESEAIAAIEAIINTPPPEPEPDVNERIAAALEFQNLMMLEDDTI
jgi:hypothetical protein